MHPVPFQSLLKSMLVDSAAGGFKMQQFREWSFVLKRPLNWLGSPMWHFSWTMWACPQLSCNPGSSSKASRWGPLLQRLHCNGSVSHRSPYCPLQFPGWQGACRQIHGFPQISSEMVRVLELLSLTFCDHSLPQDQALWILVLNRYPQMLERPLLNLLSIKMANPWKDCSSLFSGT